MNAGGTWLSGPVVVPLDGHYESVRAVPLAGRIAYSLGTEVQLLSVVDEEEDVEKRLLWIEEQREIRLGEVLGHAEVVVSDDLVGAIASRVVDEGVLCMSTAGKIRFHSGHFGSVAEGVARAVNRPLFMVGPEASLDPVSPTKRLVVPVDGSKLSEAAGPVAAQLALEFDVPMWLVSVWSPSALAAAARFEAESGPFDAVESGYVSNLARDLSKLGDIDVQFEVLHSERPARAIVDFVGDDGMAVMTTHGRTGLSRMFAGSVTAGVVARSHRAVVVLRPEGLD